MENQNNNFEEMPQAQSMKSVDKKHTILIFAGLACWLLGFIFTELHIDDVGMPLTIAGLILNCIGLYKTFKHRAVTKQNNK